MDAYTAAIAATSTEHAPWYIVPADSKLQRNLVISNVICETLDLKMRYPAAADGVEHVEIV
jgi:Uncharacterized conserved protein